MIKTKKKFKRNFKLGKSLLVEVAIVIVILAATTLKLAHIADNTIWLRLFLYDGDSLTLPMLRLSLAHKEQFLWVFSSQLNLFPEAVFYWVSSILTTSIRSSLIFNAYLNILSFYFILRLISSTFNWEHVKRRLFSLSATLILIGYMLLEKQVLVNAINSNQLNTGLATFFLFTTYYYGIILMGLFVIYIILRQIKFTSDDHKRKNLLLSLLVLVLSTATIISDPLYAIQISAPIVCALLILFILKLIKRKQFLLLSLNQIISIVFGILLRRPLSPLFAQTLGSHTSSIWHLSNWVKALWNLISYTGPLGESKGTIIRYAITIALYFSCTFYTLFFVNRKLKYDKTSKSTEFLFVAIFLCFEPIVLLFCLLGVNAFEARYLITPIVLTVLAIIILFDTKNFKKFKNPLIIGLTLTSVIVIALSTLSITKVNDILKSSAPDEQCLSKDLGYLPANGVGIYWVARYLDVYNNYNERVLQVKTNLQPLAWLNNLASYKNKKFTFVVYGKTKLNLDNPAFVKPKTLGIGYANIGTPSKTYSCQDFDINVYNPGTQGYSKLNDDIYSSLNKQIRQRSDGALQKLNGQ